MINASYMSIRRLVRCNSRFWYSTKLLSIPGRDSCQSLTSFYRRSCSQNELKKFSSKKIVATVAGKLSCDVKDAYKIFESYTQMQYLSPNQIADQIEHLFELGLSTKSIMECPSILVTDIDILEDKIRVINNIRLSDINNYVPLLTTKMPRLRRVQKVWSLDINQHSQNRIEYFSQQLESDPLTICNRFCVYQSLLFKPFNSMVDTLNFIRNYGIFDSISIVNGFRIFTHSKSYIEERIERLNANGVEIRLWMIFTSSKELNSLIKRYIDERNALGVHGNNAEFFKAKLNLDNEGVQNLFLSCERLYTCKLRRVTRIIDYLLEETTYTEENIARSPYILNYGLTAIKERIKYFKSRGIDRPLHLLFQ